MGSTILQFGTGNFLRAYFDWIVHTLNERAGTQHSIALVQSTGTHALDSLQKNNGVYHVYTVGVSDSVRQEQLEKISLFDQYVYGGDVAQLVAVAESPDLQAIVSNTTEAGIALNDEDSLDNPISFPAKLLLVLHARYAFFSKKNQADAKGLLIIPCELIERNGETLKGLVLTLAKRLRLEQGFLRWIESANAFYDTLVDRIVPGFPHNAIDEIDRTIGYRDDNIVQAELYYLLVLSGDTEKFENIFPMKRCGLRVIYTDDITPYRDRKVKILNGLHSAMVPLGLLQGIATVREAILNEPIRKFIDALLDKEIIGQIHQPREEVEAYVREILTRFENPFINHKLSDISVNSSAKIATRLLPTAVSFIKNNGALPPYLLCVLALYILFFRGVTHPIKEPSTVAAYYADIWRAYDSKSISLRDVMRKFFTENPVWKDCPDAQVLFAHDNFIDSAIAAFSAIQTSGIKKYLEQMSI